MPRPPTPIARASATLKSGKTAGVLPALEYAAKRGVLGAQLKLARIYAAGRDGVAEDDSKAFSYFRADRRPAADISPSSPIAKYVAEAFVALGQYYLDGIAAMQLAAQSGLRRRPVPPRRELFRRCRRAIPPGAALS